MKNWTIFILYFVLFSINISSQIDTTSISATISKYSDFKVTITLAKKIYEVHEPVFLKFQIINTSDDSLKIYDMFDPYVIQSNFIIEDNTGRIWDKNISHFDLSRIFPTNILAPLDTMIISMPINNWCERVNPHSIDRYDKVFGNVGFFPSGRKYKVKYSKDSIESNILSFEVENKDYEDTSAFNEYYFASKLFTKYHRVTYNREINFDNLVSDYISFIEDYPESYYLICDKFMAPFYIILFDKSTNYKKIINYIKQKTDSKLLNEFLRNSKVIPRIKNILSYYDRTKEPGRIKKSNKE